MKRKQIVFSSLIIVSMFLSLLAAPLSSSTIVKAQSNEAETITGPITVLPSGNINDTTPTYKWTTFNDSTRYHILVYRGNTLVVDEIYTNAVCSGSYCTATPTNPLPYATYTWMVRGYKNAIWTPDSPPRKFSIFRVPQPLQPAGYIYKTTPTYKWTATNSATQYQIRVYLGSTKVVDKIYPNSTCSGGYCTATPSTILALGSYTWKVRAYNNSTWGNYSNARSFTIIAPKPPKPVSPIDIIYDTTPSYKWTAVNGSTRYQIQVLRGNSIVVNKYYYANAVCSSSSCTATPTTVLPFDSYTWKARAYINGAWTSFSAPKSFIVADASGFYSTFTSNADGWVPIYGTWTLESTSPGFYKTTGIFNKSNSAANEGSFSTLDYQVKMKRVGCSFCSNSLIIRGTPTPLTFDETEWYEGYYFYYYNDGFFAVYKYSHLGGAILKEVTSTTYIDPTGWNTLRVIATGSTLKFYINGHLVWSGSDSGIPIASGQVGIAMYSHGPDNELYVDWASLTTTVSASDGDPSEPLAETGESNPDWADPNTSPH